MHNRLFTTTGETLPPETTAAPEGLPTSPILSIDEGKPANPEWLVTDLVEYAITVGASDLFFATNENEIEVTMRHLGFIRLVARLSLANGIRCIAYIRGAGNLKYAERKHPQDGRWIFHRPGGQSVDLRLSTMPTLYGESLAMRILRRNTNLTKLENLGFVGSQLGAVESLMHSPGGLILVTGPTGSGKTTTLYACLHHLNDGRRRIHTIEDPIEYAVPGLRQTQVDEANGADFPEMLRAVLRQGPDVVMIGEVRDMATAETAVRAANSGQLVLATLHAPVAASAIHSMLGLGISPYLLCSSLLGVIGQRLVRVPNRETAVPIDLSDAPATFDEVRSWLEPDEGRTVYMAPPVAGNGAGAHGPGSSGTASHTLASHFAGRTGVFEIMLTSTALRKLILDMRPASALAQQAVEERMIDFRRAALLKVAQGITSFDEMQRAVPSGSMWMDE